MEKHNISIKRPCIGGNKLFWFFKRLFDIILSISLLPILFLVTVILLMFNYFYKSGTTFYLQDRMGLYCNKFTAIKFRTMTEVTKIERQFDEPLEMNRITRLGNILRQSRLDELPQIINVLKGDMSLIGPRPDYYAHALIFKDRIKEYHLRYVIKPGISGLSQVRLGYANGLGETRKKVIVDLYYIENVSFLMDVKILLSTILVIIRRHGN